MYDSVIYIILRRMRTPLITLVVVYAIAVLGFTVIPGVDENGNVYRMDFFHAIYFVSFMGTTIGFGEIPYEFSGGQRLWTLIFIYISVISWLYAIGKLISLLQDPLFQQSVSRMMFRRQVRSIRDDYWVIFGFGDPGAQLCRLLDYSGIQTVVVDRDSQRLAELDLRTFYHGAPVSVPGDANDISIIEDALGNMNNCRGVIALTDDDETNLKIAMAARLLKDNAYENRDDHDPKALKYDHHLTVICRADSDSTVSNLESFGTEYALNPHRLFGQLLELSINQPNAYRLRRTLTAQEDNLVPEFINPPIGHWVIAGFGRFGQCAHMALKNSGCSATVLEVDETIENLPSSAIIGRGTEATTLKEANIDESVGIIAGTDHDVNNLSMIVTAHQENEDLFSIARQNESVHRALFLHSPATQVTSQSIILANRIFSLINTPLTAKFLSLSQQMDEQWCEEIMEFILKAGARSDENGEIEHRVLSTWVLRAHPKKNDRSLERRIRKYNDVRINRLCAHSVPLLLERNGTYHLFPIAGSERVQMNDRILLYSRPEVRRKLISVINSDADLEDLLDSGRHHNDPKPLRS